MSSKQRRAMLVKEDSEKPWWLRNTVYLENNLYKQQYNTNKKSLDTLSENINISKTEGNCNKLYSIYTVDFF